MSNIDVVILWVDDQDEKWRAKKNKWGNKYGITPQPERYRNWNNLKYIFRGIEINASWVNHIYLVTDDQKPSWLKLNDKVTIVDHKDIMPEEALPTFNSRAIELNLHRIKNLSEKFIYFNDDMFIIDKVCPDDFFHNENPRDLAALNIIMPIKGNHMASVIYNNTTLINDSFSKRKTLSTGKYKWFHFRNGIDVLRTMMLFSFPYFSGFKQNHLLGIYKKTTYTKVWDKYSDELMATTLSRFRSMKNHNQYLIRDWQLASNDFMPQKYRYGKAFQLATKAQVDRCCDHIIKNKTKVICVNDTEFLEDFEYAKERINSSLETIYPMKSSFEN